MAGNNSILTNQGSLVALRNMQAINFNLDKTMNKVATGLKVSNAVDDASSFAVAQGLRANVKSYSAVSQGIATALGITTVALKGLTEISDLLGDVQAKVTQLRNPANTQAQQTILLDDLTSFGSQLSNFVDSATFGGTNLLQKATVDINVLSNIDGSTLTVRASNNAYPDTVEDRMDIVEFFVNQQKGFLGNPLFISEVGNLANAVTAAQVTVGRYMGELGADTRALQFQQGFIDAIQDATEVGLGSIVDADLGKESARLQALQVQQQLSFQTLAIANQRPSTLLSLLQ